VWWSAPLWPLFSGGVVPRVSFFFLWKRYQTTGAQTNPPHLSPTCAQCFLVVRHKFPEVLGKAESETLRLLPKGPWYGGFPWYGSFFFVGVLLVTTGRPLLNPPPPPAALFACYPWGILFSPGTGAQFVDVGGGVPHHRTFPLRGTARWFSAHLSWHPRGFGFWVLGGGRFGSTHRRLPGFYLGACPVVNQRRGFLQKARSHPNCFFGGRGLLDSPPPFPGPPIHLQPKPPLFLTVSPAVVLFSPTLTPP